MATLSGDDVRMLNGREIGGLFWLTAFLVLALSNKRSRRGLLEVGKAAAKWKIWLPFSLLMAYAVGVIVLAARLGIWTTALVPASVVWFVGGAALLLLNLGDAIEQPRFYRRALLGTLAWTAFVGFVADLHPFAWWLEIPLQGVLLLVMMCGVVAATSETTQVVARICTFITAGAGLGIVVSSVFKTLNYWRQTDWIATLQALALPVWATAAVVPVIYMCALIAAYELQAMRMKFVHASDGRPSHRRRALLALMMGGNVRLRRVADLTHQGRYEMVLASGFRGALTAYGADIRRRRRQAALATEAATRLARFAGVEGADEAGHRLDQREFQATRDALRWLANCQMGWHNNWGRYRPDVMTFLDPARFGLPEDHGISLQVSKGGQQWWAARRTPSGWFLGVGAAGPTPDQWFYEGPAPPVRGPGNEQGWHHQLADVPPNWAEAEA